MTDPTDPPNIADLAKELPNLDDVANDLLQIDYDPDFEDGDDVEVDKHRKLDGDRSFLHTPTRRLFRDYRANPDAYKHLDTLPAEGESLHGIISGKYALWEMVPALIEQTHDTIDELTIATLSYSKANAAELLGLLDDGSVKRVGLLVSHFFKAQNREIYDALVPRLIERGMPVLAMRSHCKLILARMTGGAHYVVEASANLRSCVNVEQFVLTRSPELYAFHHGWLAGELLAPRE